MRPIKFRAWDTKRKKMYSAAEMGRDELTLNPDGRGFVNVNGVSTKLSHYCSHLIPMQFTSLHDKNGKEIYESDIVLFDSTVENMPNTRHVIKWLDGHFTGGGILGAGDYDGKDCEVIGNIHENPEMLKSDLGKEVNNGDNRKGSPSQV